MEDADPQHAVQADLQWKPRVDAAHGAPSAGFLPIVVGYDGSAPASRALDAAVRLLLGNSSHATHRMVGSVAVSLARHSPVPLVIVP
jgi:nucleotide-binding universal stress UspA family protein